jgi:hypothetical protein
MADTSSYSIKECLVASVWVHERQHTGQTVAKVMGVFREQFNKNPPRRATLLDWEKQVFAVGCVKDRPRQKRGVLVKGESQFHAGAGTQSNAHDDMNM